MAGDIAQADIKQEPQRSETLRSLRETVILRLHADLERYREVVRMLRLSSKQVEQPFCSFPHTSMSIKYNHIYNDELLSQQSDLFDF